MALSSWGQYLTTIVLLLPVLCAALPASPRHRNQKAETCGYQVSDSRVIRFVHCL